MVIARIKNRLWRRFLSRHRFLLYVETVLVWLLFVAAIFYGISFFAIPSAAEAKLEKLCGGAVDIQSGRLKGYGVICLRGVVVAADEQALLAAPILQADQIDIEFDVWKLLQGRFAAHAVILSDFLLTADYDSTLKKWNLSGLSFSSKTPSAEKIPRFKIHRGALRFRQTENTAAEVLATVSVNGQVAVPINMNEYGFMLETDGRFGFGPSKLQGSFRIGDDGKQSHLSATGRVTMPAAGIMQNKWDIKDITLEAAFDETAIAVKQFSFSMGQGDGQIDAVIGRTGNRPMELNIGLHGLTLSDRFDPGTVSYGWLIESSDSGFAHFLRRFRPAGAGELDLSIKGNLDDLSQTQIDGLILCKDISVRDANFPYRIEKMQGDIVFEDRTIRLQQIQSRHGDVNLELNGRITNAGPQTTIDFRVTSPDMRFDEDLYQSLSEKVKKAWYDFAPDGLTEVDYHYWKAADGNEGKELALSLKNVAASYKHFPYPLTNLTGRIILRPEQLIIEDVLAGYDNGGTIKVAGQILQPEDAESVFDVRIQGKGIPVDEPLIQALPEEYRAFFGQLQVDAMGGVSDFEVTVFPDKTDPRFLDYSTDIKVKAEAFLHDDFPLPMTDVQLAATVAGDVVRLDSFEAQSENGPIRIGASQLWSQGAAPDQPGICLALDLKDFDLNETFWGAVDQETRQKLGKLGIQGRVDVRGKLAINVPEAACGENDLVIDCSGNQLTWGDSVLGRAAGRLHLQDDRVLFSEFQVADISLDMLSKEKISPVLTQANPKGKFSVQLDDGFLKTGSNGVEGIDVNATISAEKVSFGQAEILSGLGGDCRGHFRFDFETDRRQVLAQYQVDQFVYRDRLITDLRGDLVLDPNTRRLESDGFGAALYDGNVTGNLAVQLQPEQVPRYQLELNYDNVNMQRLSAAGDKAPPQQIAQGTASGRLALEGDIDDFSTSRGTFESTGVDLQMGRQSLLGKILTAVQLKRPENFVFSEIDLNAAVLGPELIFNRIRMLGNPLVFHGQGTVNLETRRIELELASWDRANGKEETILEALARGIGSALWKVEVGGTLETPEVDAVYLSVLKHPLDVFRKKE